ncbi:hypothetical protein [Pedobacter insulae]|uniref:Uncharacterized protein n=1 Tax=Pedobacter insulae TaxID=414048 RepID=A0A1I2ZH48_9SPHI|nr:hypothetical protein [Pedobacter insulae]SFH37060.1 hypothetical protein SAMN04489864_11021 [Pedobacter insulae]
MPKLLKKEPIICLDQFVVSGMFDNSKEWLRIKEMVEITAKSGLAIYPMPLEHIVETASKFEESARGQHKFFRTISNGYHFKHHAEISAQLLVSSVRGNNITFNTFIKHSVPNDKFEGSLNTIKQNNAKYQRMISEGTLFINHLRSNSKQQSIAKSVADRMVSAVVWINANELIDRMQELVAKGGIITRGVQFKDQEVPHYIDLIIEYLLKKNKLLTKEAIELIKMLKKERYNFVSTLNIRAHIEGLWSIKKRKETSSDHIDLMRISTALQPADILFTDKARKSDLKELKFDVNYGTTVLSGTNEDIDYFERFLSNLIDTNKPRKLSNPINAKS